MNNQTCIDRYWCPVPLTFSNLHWWCFYSTNQHKHSTCTCDGYPLQLVLVVFFLVYTYIYIYIYVLSISTSWYAFVPLLNFFQLFTTEFQVIKSGSNFCVRGTKMFRVQFQQPNTYVPVGTICSGGQFSEGGKFGMNKMKMHVSPCNFLITNQKSHMKPYTGCKQQPMAATAINP